MRPYPHAGTGGLGSTCLSNAPPVHSPVLCEHSKDLHHFGFERDGRLAREKRKRPFDRNQERRRPTHRTIFTSILSVVKKKHILMSAVESDLLVNRGNELLRLKPRSARGNLMELEHRRRPRSEERPDTTKEEKPPSSRTSFMANTIDERLPWNVAVCTNGGT
ncbi:unnamed protein product [Ectocarpus sp. 13 AM-2016]